MTKILLPLAFTVAALAAAPASATINMVAASSIQGDNVLFNNGEQIGTQVQGWTQDLTFVFFTGTTVDGADVIRANGGQARIEGDYDTVSHQPNDTLLLKTLNFALAGGRLFNNLEFNVSGGDATSATFVLTDNEGQDFTFTNQSLAGSGFFGFQGVANESIAHVAITFNGGGVDNVGQFRLDPLAVPEPATWGLMIIGFGAMGLALRRRRPSHDPLNWDPA